MTSQESRPGVGPLSPDQLALRERVLGGEVGIVTITGESYAGKTGLAQRFRKKLGIPLMRTFLAGQTRREKSNTGQGAQGFIPRTRESDEEIDNTQQAIAFASTPQNPALIESRLAPLMVNMLKEEHPETVSISVLLVASKEVRMWRAVRRSFRNQVKNLTRLAKRSNETGISSEEKTELIREYNTERSKIYTPESVTEYEDGRAREDEERFREIYPWFREIEGYYLDPSLQDKNGRRVYDIVVNTDGIKEDDLPEVVFERIIEFRQSEEFRRINTEAHRLPQNGDVFAA